MKKRKLKNKESPQPKPSVSPNTDFPIIPNTTMETILGAKRWAKLVRYIKRKYRTRRVMLGYHEMGKGAFLYVANQCIGSVGRIESNMKREQKKNKSLDCGEQQ